MSNDLDQIREVLRERLRRGEREGFEQLYSSANFDAAKVPWADLLPNPRVTEWLDREQVKADGRKALVIGCGLGDDAEELARRGFDVTAFDISPTAIDWCHRRFGQSRVRYVSADLLAPPPQWSGGFDFVLEVFTLQALPPQYRDAGVEQVARLVAPAGSLLVVCRARHQGEPLTDAPYPLSRAELTRFTTLGLTEISVEDFVDPDDPPVRSFRAHYVR